jgi:hypothetical protein
MRVKQQKVKALYYNTVSPLLLNTLKKLMEPEVFKPFRLVGGTCLSLQLGHRQSIDIDLFTDYGYSSIDFGSIEEYLLSNFPYTDSIKLPIIGMGKSFFIGESFNHCIKLDVYYTDKYIRPIQSIDGIRLAALEDIVAMKIEVISSGGRKKDFWDIHELLQTYSLDHMLKLHEERNPYTHNRQDILESLINFEKADYDFEPLCLKNKNWQLIKLDLIEFVKSYNGAF